MELLGLGMGLAFAALLLFTLYRSFIIVSQSQSYVIERLGKYNRVAGAGLHVLVPFLETVRRRVDIMERPLDPVSQDAITNDNVVIEVTVAVFFRVTKPERMVYRIKNIEAAVTTTVAGIVRSEIGTTDLDKVQSNRSELNLAIKEQLGGATRDWGIDITRAEVLDVKLNERTRDAMMQQLNAERKRRASVTDAEGAKRTVELSADAGLYEARRRAEGRKVIAEADAYAIEIVSKAISAHGEQAVEFEIRKRQIETMGKVASGESTRTVILPAELADAFGKAADLLKKR